MFCVDGMPCLSLIGLPVLHIPGADAASFVAFVTLVTFALSVLQLLSPLGCLKSSDWRMYALFGSIGAVKLTSACQEWVNEEFSSTAAVQDGGYHVPFAHKALASGLSLDSYSSNLYDRLSIQSCPPQDSQLEPNKRLGKSSLQPEFM